MQTEHGREQHQDKSCMRGLDCVGGRVETSWWSTAAVLLASRFSLCYVLCMLAGAAWGGGRSGFAEAPPGCCGAEMAAGG